MLLNYERADKIIYCLRRRDEKSEIDETDQSASSPSTSENPDPDTSRYIAATATRITSKYEIAFGLKLYGELLNSEK